MRGITNLRSYRRFTVNKYRDSKTCDFDTFNYEVGKKLEEYVKFNKNTLAFCNGHKINGNYKPLDNDLITIRQYEGAITTAIITGLIVSNVMKDEFEEAYNENLKKLETEDTSAVNTETKNLPSIAGAKNTSQLGKVYPFILGKHFFSPYYIGRPYKQISVQTVQMNTIILH